MTKTEPITGHITKDFHNIPRMIWCYDLKNKTVENDDYKLKILSPRYPKDAVNMLQQAILPDDYVMLWSKKRHTVVMSDTPMERYTNQAFIENAKGDVLIGGLGIGMLIAGLIWKNVQHDDQIVDSITVIEKDTVLIELMKPIIEDFTDFVSCDLGYSVTLNIIQDDVYTYPDKHPEKKYDYVYIDIWDDYLGYREYQDIFLTLKELYQNITDHFDAWGYFDAFHNEDDLSPIEQSEFAEYTANMVNYRVANGEYPKEILINLDEYANAIQ